MRSLLLSALAATTVLAATSVGLTTDANAAARRLHHSFQAAPIVRQDPSASFNTYSPTYDVRSFGGGRDVNPISGTPRWDASGGAP
jgi:hypothetical protein